MKKYLDQSLLSYQMVIAGLVGMIDDDGLTVHEVFEVLEDIKREVFPALAEISRERKVTR